MSRVCALTGKRPSFGRNVSHSNQRTRRRFMVNIQRKRIFVPELGRSVRLRVSTAALRTLDKKGSLSRFLRDEGKSLKSIL